MAGAAGERGRAEAMLEMNVSMRLADRAEAAIVR
jgi:hypothetical protein